jgi:hypothetical protein
MTSDFEQVGKANFRAFYSNPRRIDVVTKKQEIIDDLETFHNLSPTSVLFVGFSSFIFAQYNANLYITMIDDEIKKYLADSKISYTYVAPEELIKNYKKYEVVIASDEFFTYTNDDVQQRQLVTDICSLATGYVITTLRDYKNQDFKDREFSFPLAVRTATGNLIFLESHEYHNTDRNNWQSTIYQIQSDTQEMTVYGKFNRRTMFFKQLAKFSLDAGAENFLVHKNLMYKSLIKKNYEHVISIRFQQ